MVRILLQLVSLFLLLNQFSSKIQEPIKDDPPPDSHTMVTPMGSYVKFENYSSILLAQPKLLNEEDPDSQFYSRGEFSFDYIVRVGIGKEFYRLKLDLTSDIPFVTDISCKTCFVSNRYFADFSDSASKISEYDSICSVYEDEYSSNGGFIDNEECQFYHNHQELEIRFNGFLSKDKVSFSPEYPLEKQMVGRIFHQNKNFVYKGINGFLGLGPGSYQNLFIKGMETVYSLCSNSHVEGGGYLIAGGVDKSMMKGQVNWIPYSSYLHYDLPIQEIKVGKVSISGDLMGVIDTKYEFIIVDNHILQNIKREIKSVM